MRSSADIVVSFHAEGELFDLDLLQDAYRLVRVDQLAAAKGTARVVVDPRDVDLVRLEGLALVSLVARLGAPFAIHWALAPAFRTSRTTACTPSCARTAALSLDTSIDQ
jgi:hypothetical protein